MVFIYGHLFYKYLADAPVKPFGPGNFLFEGFQTFLSNYKATQVIYLGEVC